MNLFVCDVADLSVILASVKLPVIINIQQGNHYNDPQMTNYGNIHLLLYLFHDWYFHFNKLIFISSRVFVWGLWSSRGFDAFTPGWTRCLWISLSWGLSVACFCFSHVNVNRKRTHLILVDQSNITECRLRYVSGTELPVIQHKLPGRTDRGATSQDHRLPYWFHYGQKRLFWNMETKIFTFWQFWDNLWLCLKIAAI